MADRAWIWFDAETSGLVAGVHKILEVGCIVTDFSLNTLAEYEATVFRPDVVTLFDQADEVVQDMHSENGLWEACADEEKSKPLKQIERDLVWLVGKHGGRLEEWRSPMCGNTPSFDRMFLKAEMPDFAGCFSYHHIDVSTLTELYDTWFKKEDRLTDGSSVHRAIFDVRHSIKMLRFYKSHVFSPYIRASDGGRRPWADGKVPSQSEHPVGEALEEKQNEKTGWES